jgi:hypothetical protein
MSSHRQPSASKIQTSDFRLPTGCAIRAAGNKAAHDRRTPRRLRRKAFSYVTVSATAHGRLFRNRQEPETPFFDFVNFVYFVVHFQS